MHYENDIIGEHMYSMYVKYIGVMLILHLINSLKNLHEKNRLIVFHAYIVSSSDSYSECFSCFCFHPFGYLNNLS